MDDRPVIGIWPEAERSWIWPEIETLLRPAADLVGDKVDTSDFAEVWTVHEAGELLAAATVRLKVDGAAEFHLVGGRDAKRWWRELAEKVGEWAKLEGCDRLTAYGRKGWARVLDWEVVGEKDGIPMYLKRLS